MFAPEKESYDQLSVLKSRDISLPTKVHIVKAMVFPVVMYGCESWTIEKLSQVNLNICLPQIDEYLTVYNHNIENTCHSV